MTPDSIFSICSSIALAGWLILIIASPFWFETDKLLIGIIITLLTIVYTWLIAQSFHPGDVEKFSTLNGVIDLFTSKTVVAAGWVHYLAFDLMTGIWIKKNSEKYGISHLLNYPLPRMYIYAGAGWAVTLFPYPCTENKEFFC